MLLGLSLEVHVPLIVDRDALLRIGKAFAPQGMDTEGMDEADAVEYGFSDPDGIAALMSLGVVWATVRNGPVIPNGL